MTDESNLSTAMKKTDEAINYESNVEHLGAIAINSVLEGMWTMHARLRMVGPDFKATRIIHRVLVNLAEANMAEHRSDVAPAEKLPSNPVLDSMDTAGNDAEALKQAAQ